MKKQLFAVLLAMLLCTAAMVAASPPGHDEAQQNCQILAAAITCNDQVNVKQSSDANGKEVVSALCQQTSVLSNENNLFQKTTDIAFTQNSIGAGSEQWTNVCVHMKISETYIGDQLPSSGEAEYKRDAYQWRNRQYAQFRITQYQRESGPMLC